MSSDFWEQDEQVERFAGRDPDRRLVALIEKCALPPETRVLDIGCAGGRNTALLAQRGFDVYAIDSSSAMVAHTRERVSAIVGSDEAAARVRVGHMEDLSSYPDGGFDLVVALGVFHAARSREQWETALSEAARVTRSGGCVLVSVFSPRTDMTGRGISAVPGEPHVFEGLPSGRHYLVEADVLDKDMARFGLTPMEPTDTVVVPMEDGRRVTVNGIYRRADRV